MVFQVIVLASILSALAHIPGTALNAVRIVTDSAEYVTGKVAQGFAKLDYYADEAETALSNTGNTPAEITAKQAKLAKIAAKKAARIKK